MEGNGKMLLRTEERLKRWFRKEVICSVEIWNEGDDKKLVIMSSYDYENKKPIATTNNFKKIANAIKEKHLKEIADHNILWSESACWDGAVIPIVREVTL